MTTFTLTAQDTFVVYGRVLADQADDDVSTITFPNDFVKMKTGKNENTIFSKDAAGNNADVVLRIIKGSGDDQFLQSQISAMEQDFASTTLAAGTFVKRMGDGLGNVKFDNYTLSGGVITRKVDGKENASGDTGQGVAIYNMKFAKVVRSIQ